MPKLGIPRIDFHIGNNKALFISSRFAWLDAIPEALRNEWQSERTIWLRLHPQPWTAQTEQQYHRRFSGEVESWLDAGHGSCVLRRPDCAQIIDQGIRYFDGERLALISSVVMPNHVHAIFVQKPECSAEELIRSWKTFSARKINSLLGRSGSLWQRDYSIGLCVISSIWQIACVTLGEIRRKRVWLRTNLSYTKTSWRGQSTNKERRSPTAIYFNRRLGSRRSLGFTSLCRKL